MATKKPKTGKGQPKVRARDKAIAGVTTAVAEPQADLLTGDDEGETVGISVVETNGETPSETPSFGNAVIVESPTQEMPVAISTTTTDGEPKIKSAAQKKWREKNREKVQAYQKKWREKNKEKVKAIHTNYRKKNPEKVKEWQKASQGRRKERLAQEKSTTAAAAE